MITKNKFIIISFGLLILTNTFFSSQVSAQQSPKTISTKHSHRYIDGEVLVKYKDAIINLKNISGQSKAKLFAANKNFSIKKQIKHHNLTLLKSNINADTETLVKNLQADPNVEYAQPNYQYTPTDITSNDTFRGDLWGLDNTGQNVNGVTGTLNADIGAPEAWSINEGTNSTTIVAVIDTGVAYNHPDLADNMWDGTNCKDENGADLGGCQHGYDYEDGDKIPLPTNNTHGTHVAGTIAAVKNNSKGIIGVAPHAKIMALKSNLTTDNIILAIDFAKQNGAKVINASWGGPSNDILLKNAIDSFPGLFVAAAGNENSNNDNTPLYPCSYDSANIICVAATDQADALANFSDFGTSSVDIAAPGVNILSAIDNTEKLSETFEELTPPTLPNGWIATGTNSNWGTKNIGLGFGNVLIADVSSTYHDNASSTITSPAFDFSTSTGATISFAARCDTQYITDGWADYMELEYSTDGINFSTTTDPNFSSSTDGFRWDEATFDILNGEFPLNSTSASSFQFSNIPIPAQYLTSTFKLRFHWVSDATDNAHAGCSVDNLTITTFSDGSDEKYTYLNGTSMATPHVVGLSALLWGYKPNLTVSQIKNNILNNGDTISALSTKTLTGKRINAFASLQAVTSPTAVTSTPTNSSSSVVLNIVPTIIFSKNINTTTLQTGIELRKYNTDTIVTSTITAVNSTTASITPSANLSPSTTYYLFVSSSIQDTDGNNLEEVWTDKTAHAFSTVPDTGAPIITLTGASTINLHVGDTYTELGATATDTIDGSIHVTTTGSVNTNTAGTYTVTYTATDLSQNSASTTRTVNVTAVPHSGGGGGGGSSGGGGGSPIVTVIPVVIATTTIATTTTSTTVINNPVERLPSSTIPSQYYLFNETTAPVNPTPKSKIQTLLDLVKFGDINKNVKQLQLELVRLGFLPKKFSATNYYGKTTDTAVKKYLASLTNKSTVKIPSAQPNLDDLIAGAKYGTHGNNIKQLQIALKNIGLLKAAVTGYYGSATKAAVQKYLNTK